MIWNVQLVFDCDDPDTVMLFWGRTLEYEGEYVWSDRAALQEWRKSNPQYDGHGRIDDGAARRMPIYIQKVPEPKTQPNRIRLEIGAPHDRIENVRRDAIARGATVDDSGFQDPEGNEFTIVATDEPDLSLRTVTIDALDPARMVEFWAAATGYRVADGQLVPPPVRIERGALVVGDHRVEHPLANWALGIVNEPANMPNRIVLDLTPAISFRRVDEAKAIKNRLHFDIRSTDRETDLARVKELGATVRRAEDEFSVLQDPEGNEFCL